MSGLDDEQTIVGGQLICPFRVRLDVSRWSGGDENSEPGWELAARTHFDWPERRTEFDEALILEIAEGFKVACYVVRRQDGSCASDFDHRVRR